MTPTLTTYKKLCTEYYDLEQHPYDAQAQAFYQKHAHAANGPVLEPMCGTGRFLLPLLCQGIPIEGFDASPHMLAALQTKYAALKKNYANLPLHAPVHQQFVQEFTVDKQYHLIFIPYGSFGLITNLAQAQEGINRLWSHLAPGGKLIVEIETVASVPDGLGIWHRGLHNHPEGGYIAINTFPTYTKETQEFKAICRYERIINGRSTEVETEDFYMHLYHFDEFDTMLQRAGCTNLQKYDNYQQSPATPLTKNIIYVCSKNN